MDELNNSKAEKLDLLCLRVSDTLIQTKSKKINISRVVDGTNISRAWVYKYLGSDQEKIILNIIDIIASRFTEASEEKPNLTSKKELIDYLTNSTEKTLSEVSEYPGFYKLYLYGKTFNKEYKKRFDHHEQSYLAYRFTPTLQNALKLDLAQASIIAKFLHEMRMGFVFSWFHENDKSSENKSQKIDLVKKMISSFLSNYS